MPTGLLFDIRAALNLLLSILVGLVPGFNSLFGAFNSGNPNSFSNKVLANTQVAVADLESPVFGLAQLHAQLTDVQTAIVALGSPQQADVAVTLPEPPPTGYGGANPGDIALAVWQSPLGTLGETADSIMDQLAAIEINFFSGNAISFPVWNSRVFYVTGDWNATNISIPQIGWVEDYTDFLAFDHIYDWYHHHNPFDDPVVFPGGPFQIASPEGEEQYQFWCPYTDFDYALWKAAASIAPVNTPPVWPGLESVTLGDPVALADGAVVPGPMDGLLIQIDSVAPPISFYPFGDVKSYVRVGAVVFASDDGDYEFAQPVAIERQVICPKTMTQAASAVMRIQSGTVGTATPWSINL